ncbi:HYR domain-containing protein [Aureivirga sp. CE67]|uniref:HYR domain-containing protein n=1 Tax=Aureivirga sp. CE67 TaxID=1788983 RepID=UPI0018C96464|nr:HYR domain-containing protein [Aureivirga sp. CE67]
MRKLLYILFLNILFIQSALATNFDDDTSCVNTIIKYVNVNATPGGDGTSWSSAYNILQDALTGDLTNVEIWVAEGTYYPTQMVNITDVRSRSFILTSEVKIYGGFNGTETDLSQRDHEENQTILSADFEETPDNINDNAYQIMYILGISGNNTLIDGFTIKDGLANGPISYDRGGGIYIKNSLAHFKNIIIDNCSADYGGAICANNSITTFENVEFKNNHANVNGGAVFNEESVIQTLTNVIVNNNSSDLFGGGMYNEDSSITMINVLFYENTTQFYGGGIRNKNSTITINNGTVANNTVAYAGAGIANDQNTNVYLNNSIIYGNEANTLESIYNTSGSKVYVKYSLIDGGIGTSAIGIDLGNNVDFDPIFADVEAGNFRLEECSPAINIGNNTLNTFETDLDNNSRVYNSSTIDLGAYEFQGEPLVINTPVGDSPQSFCNIIPLSDIQVTSQVGTEIVWYDSETSDTPLDSSINIVSGTTYWAQANSTSNICISSGRLPVQVLVQDNEFPVINGCVGIQLLNPEADCKTILPDYSDLLDVTDNCNYTVVQTPAAGTEISNTTNITLTVTDDAGNETSCSFIVISQDISPAQLICQDDITVNTEAGLCGATVSYDLPEVQDNCDSDIVPTLVNGIVSGGFFPVGETINTFQIEDSLGNIVTCTQKVIVQENSNVELSCPDDITMNIDAAECGAHVTFDLPQAMNFCGDTDITQETGLVSGELFPVGETLNSYTIVTDSGEVFNCSFTVTVINNLTPTINCPSDITMDTNSASCSSVVSYELPTISDNCYSFTVTQTEGLASGQEFPVGETTNTFIFTSTETSETYSCSFKVILNSTNDVSLSCPENIVVDNDVDQCGAIINYEMPSLENNCEEITITQTSGFASGEMFPIGITTNTFIIENSDGETTECSFTVEVEDTQTLVLTCSGNIEVNNDPGQCGAVVDFEMPTIIDNCSPISIIQTEGLESGEMFPIGMTNISYEIISTDGTFYTCTFEVNVIDTEEPQVQCTEDIVVQASTSNNGQCGEYVVYDTPLMVDNCLASNNFVLVEGLASGELFPIGETTNVYQYTNIEGELFECSFTVTVTSHEEFTLEGYIANHSLKLNADCEIIVANYINLNIFTPSIDCGDVIFTQVPAPLTHVTEDTDVTVTVTNGSGESDSFTFTVFAIDDTDPEFVEECITSDYKLLPNGEVYFMEDYIEDIEVIENCGYTITQDPEVGEQLPFGNHIVTINVTDNGGNTISCQFDLQLEEEPKIGIDEEELLNLTLYPNPTTDVFYVSSKYRIDTIEIYSVLGNRIKVIEANNVTDVDISELASGTYHVICKSKDLAHSSRIIKK